MNKKSHAVTVAEFIVNVVFYPVLLFLLLMLVVVFSKEVYQHCSKQAKTNTPVSVSLLSNKPSHTASDFDTFMTKDVSDPAREEMVTEVAQLYVVPCHVIVKGEPEIEVENIEVDMCTEPEVPFSVPLDAEIQNHIIQVCDAYQVNPALVISLIQRESNFNSHALGDGGSSEGLMQIKRIYHSERMARLGCYDLLDPKQNVSVGVDFLAELLNTYGTVEMALMVYNAGAAGANNYWFSQGIYSTEYSRDVLATMEALCSH